MRFRIDIENSAGVIQGDGPITSALHFEASTQIDSAGSFSFTMPAADDKAALLVERSIARCYGVLDGVWTEIGAGIIDDISLGIGADGEGVYNVSGMGITRELAMRSVRNLELASAGSFMTHAAAITAIDAYSPAGWTITPDASPPNDNVYGRFGGESVLSAFARVAEKTGTHYYYSAGRNLIFASTFADSGQRAIQGTGDLASGLCGIVALERMYDSYELKTRIIPYGAGQGDTRLTLAAVTRTPASGYTLDTSNNYIENDAAVAAYGVDEIALEFKDVGPISNTDADVQAAANSLYDVAYEWLRRHKSRGEFYSLTLVECDTVLRPMQTIRVVYRDERQDIEIDADLNILGASVRVDVDGLRTTSLNVSTLDRWAETDAGAIVASIEQGRVYQAIPQLNANSYTTSYRKNIDDTETATIRVRFGNEVTQLQQVLLDFQLLPFESTVKTVALDSMTGGAGELETDPSASTMGAISNNSSGESTPNATGEASISETGEASPTAAAAGEGETGSVGSNPNTGGTAPNTGGKAPDTGGKAPDTGGKAPDTGTADPISGGAAPNAQTSSPETGSKAPTAEVNIAADTGPSAPTAESAGGDPTGSSGDDDTGSFGSNPNTGATAPSTAGTAVTTQGTAVTTQGTAVTTENSSITLGDESPDTGDASGGDVDVNGQHSHQFTFQRETFDAAWYTVYYHDSDKRLKVSDGTGGTFTGSLANESSTGNHTHSVNDHSHTTDAHSHTSTAHSHTSLAHTHTSVAHIHTTVAHFHTTTAHVHTNTLHSHTTLAHVHTTTNHTHATGAHTHTTLGHTHTTVAHNHTTIPHSHTTQTHYHTSESHTHTTASHTHTTASHTHTTAAHTHTTAAHVHTTGAHTHTTAAHTHTVDHTHSLNNHVHSLNNHQHTMTPSITTVYGIFREDLANTYGIDDLEYRVNSGSWVALNTATDLGGSWYQIDLTSALQTAGSLRPVGGSNTVDIRKTAAAVDDKTVTVDALLSVRNIVQGIAYA